MRSVQKRFDRRRSDDVAARGPLLHVLCAFAFALVAGLAATDSAHAQAQDGNETFACNGTSITRAVCKPGGTCNNATNVPVIQAGAGAGLRAVRANTITFTGIPAAGATITYDAHVPTINTAALADPSIVQDTQATISLDTEAISLGPLTRGGPVLQHQVTGAPGYVETFGLVETGSSLRVATYKVTCTPNAAQ
ncbi:MAG: hypothetical protein ABL907_08965, partial [Hyphomicrobium sp.]